jgi:hypothetical protein
MQRFTRSAAAADAASAASARAEALRYNFISSLILAAQNGFGQDVDHLAALCWETWGEEQWWDAVKDLPHGRVRREGPAEQYDAAPFGCERGPFSARRTHLMRFERVLKECRRRYVTRLSLPSATIFDGDRGRAALATNQWNFAVIQEASQM